MLFIKNLNQLIGEVKIKVEQIAKTIVIERKSSKIQKILQKILDYQSSITILTDFKSIEIASKSFYRLFGIEDKNTFFKIYPNLLDVFVKHDKYLHGDTEEKFLRNYENLTQENRIVSTASMYGDVKAFYIEIDKIDELYILTLTDITKIQEEKLEAQYKATHDKLTELYNKSKFELCFLKIDNAYIQTAQMKKCDYLVLICELNKATFVELKDDDIIEAFSQLRSTIKFFCAKLCDVIVKVRIVLTKVKRPNLINHPEYLKLKKMIKKINNTYNSDDIKYASRYLEESC